MDKLEQYRDIIEKALREVVRSTEGAETSANANIRDKAVFDRRADSYLIVRQGWDGCKHINSVVAHLEILDGKIWVQEDWLEDGITAELEAAGIPKSDIVLGFYPADVRPHTEYAVA